MSHKPMSGSDARLRKIMDLLLCVAVATVIVAAFVLYSFHQARAGASPKLPLKWLGFVSMTAIVFGYAIRASWRTRSGPKFWLLLGAFFVVHTAVGIVALMRVETVPMLLYGLLGGPEYLLLAYYLDFFLKPDPRYR